MGKPTAEVKASEPTAEVKATEPTAEVKASEPTFEDALAPKPDRVKGNGDRLGLYVVLTGASAKVVKLALAKVGETNYAAYMKRLLLADLKSRLNGK